MHKSKLSYQKVKKIYLKFLKSQEVLSEPFRDKISQLNNFYLPISDMIHKTYLKNKKTKVKMTVDGYYTDDNGFWTIYKTESGMTVMKKEKKDNG